ncbi:hypothetical protein ABFV99_13720 [Cytobacillus horneckiae]|uniref:hypothetical protein n=1 Tax=Cytobacillus horneckiae TaxID=549687 RepID=UPI0034CDD3CE
MIQITIGNEQLPHIEYEKDGNRRSFDIDHNTLFEFIQMNCYDKQVVDKKFEMPVFETPALPPGTVKYMAMPDGKVILFMEQKETRFDIRYHSTPFKQVPFPNLLFVFVFTPQDDKFRLTNKKCYTFEDKVFRDNTKLYRFPFSHVQNDGEMCFFFLTELQDLAQMTSFIHNWMSVSFTDHYYNETNKNKWGWPLRQIFNQTQGQSHFDYTKLIEEELTVNDLVSSFANRYFPV